MEDKNKTIIPRNIDLQTGIEASKTLAELAKEVLKYGKRSEDITKADQQSTTEYYHALTNTLEAVNKELSECHDLDEKSALYKQREDILNRMQEEKEKQRYYHNEREDKDRNQSKHLFAVVATIALGAGTVAAKMLIDTRRT